MIVRYIGPFCQSTGYSRAGHDYLEALLSVGVDVQIQPMLDCNPDTLEPRYSNLLEHVLVGGEPDPDVLVVHTIPMYASEFVSGDMEPPDHVARVCLTTWETDTWPDDIAADLDHAFDAIVVPSSFNEISLVKALGPRTDQAEAATYRVPHCYDPEFWRTVHDIRRDGTAAQQLLQDKSRPFTFYHIGVWGERKNPAGVLKAYLSEFTDEDDVLLKMVLPHTPPEEVGSLLQRMGLEDLPRVEWLGTPRLTEDSLLALHAMSDCYVTAARGEAWGLGPFEAAICGNVVISTEFGGQMDFLRDYPRFVSYPHILTPAIADAMQVAPTMRAAGLDITFKDTVAPVGIDARQSWAEPDLVALRKRMRQAYRTRPHTKRDHDLASQFSYPVVGAQLRDVLVSVAERRRG